MNEEDERIGAWSRVAAHPFFESAYKESAPLIDAMIATLDRMVATKEESANSDASAAEEPREWLVLRAFSNGFIEGLRRGQAGRFDH